MKVEELLNRFKEENQIVIINGIVGKLTEVGEVIALETIRKSGKELTKEITYIPLGKVETISLGEKPIPKTESEKKIEEDLKGL